MSTALPRRACALVYHSLLVVLIIGLLAACNSSSSSSSDDPEPSLPDVFGLTMEGHPLSAGDSLTARISFADADPGEAVTFDWSVSGDWQIDDDGAVATLTAPESSSATGELKVTVVSDDYRFTVTADLKRQHTVVEQFGFSTALEAGEMDVFSRVYDYDGESASTKLTLIDEDIDDPDSSLSWTVPCCLHNGVYPFTLSAQNDSSDPVSVTIHYTHLSDSHWPTEGGNLQGTGQALGESARGATNEKRWHFKTDSRIDSTPVIGAGGVMYVTTNNGVLYAVDTETGQSLWKSDPADESFSGGPAIGADGVVYATTKSDATSTGKLYALDPSNEGAVIWSQDAKDFVSRYSNLTIGRDGSIILAGDNGTVQAFSATDGSPLWDREVDGSIYSTPGIGLDGTVYVSSTREDLNAIDPSTGEIKWTFNEGDGTEGSPVIGPDGTIYLSSGDESVYAVSPDNELIWRRVTNQFSYGAPALSDDGRLYLGTEESGIFTLNAKTGEILWSILGLPSEIAGKPVIDRDGNVYFGLWRDSVRSYSPDGTLRWQFSDAEPSYQSLAMGPDGTIYAPSGGDLDHGIVAIK